MKRSLSPKKSNEASKEGSNLLAQSTEDKEEAHVELFTNMFTDVFGSEILIDTSTFVLVIFIYYTED